MASKNKNPLSDGAKLPDDEKSSIPTEEDQQYSERTGLAGPMNLLVCIGFIIMCHTNATSDEHFSVDTDKIVDMLSTNNADIDDEIDQLEELAKRNLLNFYTCIINQNEKSFYYMNATSVEENQTWSRACLVFDKNYRSFYVFYVRDNNQKNHTMFSMNDKHILKLFEDSVEVYKWPGDFDTIKQMSDQDISMSDEEKIPISPIDCNIEYQIPDHHLMSPKTVREVLTFQMQQLLEISDLTAESFTTNRKASTSIESAEARNIVSNESANSHEQDILSNDLILTQSSLPNTKNNSKETISLSKLELVNQPTRFWHHRNLDELRDNRCPAVHVEGHGQRASLQVKLPENIREYEEEMYIGAHAVTYDKKEHDQKFVVPINTSIKEGYNLKTNDLNCLTVINDEKNHVEFDLKTRGVFSKIYPNEWTFKMVNLYQDNIITKTLIKNKKLKWCRLMFAIYVKLRTGRFECVSSPIFSDLIKETYGAQSVKIDRVFPNKICKRGGQMIFVPLQTAEEKQNLDIKCNDKKLNDSDFQIAETILSFESPVCMQGSENLHVIIHIKNTEDRIDFTLPYHRHSIIRFLFYLDMKNKNSFLFIDDHPDPCGMVNED
ncbi:unnamed protein product [Rotaria sp. Silwood2]|nr:unnamed protein product [Rotaria sp. Silwood2]CAF4137585.1 unnamed protein product [Rotaria sp. Silwood2]